MPLCLHKRRTEKIQSLQERVVGRKTRVVHLTHNDLDAAGSDAICRMVLGPEILTFFSSVNRFCWLLGQIGRCNGKEDHLIISDFGYQKGIEEQVRKAHAAGWMIEWYDHHKWTEEEKERILPFVMSLTVDTSVCAAGVIRASLAKGNTAAAEVARVVCDYDLWKHEDPRSAVLGMIASKQEYLELIRNKLFEGILIDDEISRIFAGIEQERNTCTKKSIRHAKIFRGKYVIAVMPAYGYPSETAVEARKKLGCNMELLVFDTGKFSLRSVAPVSHLIARQFNGGGHPNASGGNFAYGWKEKWLLKLFGRVSRAREFIEVAEAI